MILIDDLYHSGVDHLSQLTDFLLSGQGQLSKLLLMVVIKGPTINWNRHKLLIIIMKNLELDNNCPSQSLTFH